MSRTLVLVSLLAYFALARNSGRCPSHYSKVLPIHAGLSTVVSSVMCEYVSMLFAERYRYCLC